MSMVCRKRIFRILVNTSNSLDKIKFASYNKWLGMNVKNAGIWSSLFSRRSLYKSCRNNCKSNDVYEVRGEENVKKDIEIYLSEKSPLKNLKENDSGWATTPYPTGTIISQPHVKIDPEKTSVIMFPGQGCQYVGMGKSLFEFPVVEQMFESASSILGYNLKKLCLQGPIEKLNKTAYCQPAVLVCSLASVEVLKSKYPYALTSCSATCGFSLGEITALVFAGSINFENAVHITRVRANAMQACSDAVSSGMLTVLYGADSDIYGAMKDAKYKCLEEGINDPVCEIANYLIPECKVLAGHMPALKYIQDNKEHYKIRKTSMLPVSGAFHTSLMDEAKLPFQAALKNITVKDPIVPVLSNELGKPYGSAQNIISRLPRQLCKPVKWEQIIHYIYERSRGVGFPQTYVCGPDKSLSILLSRINSLAAKNCHNIYV